MIQRKRRLVGLEPVRVQIGALVDETHERWRSVCAEVLQPEYQLVRSFSDFILGSAATKVDFQLEL